MSISVKAEEPSAGVGIMSEARKVLRNVFGYDSFRGQQADVIGHLAQGGEALVLMPTGGGKSLCYQIPALLRSGTGVVISPLIALMQDQVGALVQNGVRAAFLNSTQSLEESRDVEHRLLRGDLDLLYLAPERLSNPRVRNLLAQAQIALFAIDEAHCVSQWGHDFRPEYLQLSMLAELFPQVPRVALTATADDRTREEIVKRLGLEHAARFISGFDRPNIRYRITQKQNGREQLLRFLEAEHKGDSGIVYCLSRKKVEATAEWLQQKGWSALPYHAGLSAQLREHHQDRFLKEEGLVIVATIAFGMGIDKSNVRFVAHMDLPKSLEAYYQETGRAGRDGLPANAWMAYGLQDVITLRQMLESSEAAESHKRVERHKLEAMLAFCELTGCRRQTLLRYFGEEAPDPCGNCDTCLEPVPTWNATEPARKAMSCVYRTGQRYGVNHLIDVLQGKSNERITSAGHDRLSVYGIGRELDASQWRSVFRQLVARGLLTVDVDGYGGLRLTEECRAVLRGEQALHLREDPKRTPARAASRGKTRADARFLDGDAERLWEALRTCRRRIAEEQGVPPYIIFHDATLMEMVEHRPATLAELARLSGVGERKLALYGGDFISVIAEHGQAEPEEGGSSSEQSVQLFRAGKDVAAIAAERGVRESTVYGHLAPAIAAGELEVAAVVGLPTEDIDRIEQALVSVGVGARLKEVHAALEGAFHYGILRCVRAGLWPEKEKA